MRTGLLRGAAAGAAGTTALNAATYFDMAIRGRGASSAPEVTVQKATHSAGLRVPGTGQALANRREGLGALSGIATGVGVGAALGVLRRLGLRPGPVVGSVLAAALAMTAANLPMAALRVSDPRDWSLGDWAADVVPHLAYGLVTQAGLMMTEAQDAD